MGSIDNNPVKQIRRFKERYRNRVLSLYEVTKLLDECRNSKNNELIIIVLIAIYTGMRRGEILNLKLSNIDSEYRYLELDGKQTKSGYSRVIPLHPALQSILQNYRFYSNDRVFKSKYIRRAFENAVKRARIEKFTFRDMRRTCATYLKNNLVQITVISELLGHCNVKMTEAYLVNNFDDMAKAVNTLNFT